MTLRERLYRFRSFWMFPLIAVVLLYSTSRAEPEADATGLLWLVPLGVLIWTLLEYVLHRFVFHIQTPLRNPQLRGIFNASHLGHHASPRDRGKVLVHSKFALAISAALYAAVYAVTVTAGSRRWQVLAGTLLRSRVPMHSACRSGFAGSGVRTSIIISRTTSDVLA
jgi:hypothetical protein